MIRVLSAVLLAISLVLPSAAAAASLSEQQARDMIKEALETVRKGGAMKGGQIRKVLEGNRFLARSLDSPAVARVRYGPKTYTSTYRGVTGRAEWHVDKNRFCYRWPTMRKFACFYLARVKGGLVLFRPGKARQSVALVPRP
jgi:hypothetical protein